MQLTAWACRAADAAYMSAGTWRRMEPRRASHPHFAGEQPVATAVAEHDYIVKDITLAQYGRD
jgi:hypothetical protein